MGCSPVTVSDPARRVAAERAWRELRPKLTDEAHAALGEEGDAFLARAELALFDVHAPLARAGRSLLAAREPLAVLYGEDADLLFARALRIVLAAAAERPTELRRL